MSKHTPEPWEIDTCNPGMQVRFGRRPDPWNWVGTVYGGLRPAGEDLANATRIVDCINGCLGIKEPATTVPELVEVLTEIKASGVVGECAGYFTVQISHPTMEAIKAVLAKTGAQKQGEDD